MSKAGAVTRTRSQKQPIMTNPNSPRGGPVVGPVLIMPSRAASSSSTGTAGNKRKQPQIVHSTNQKMVKSKKRKKQEKGQLSTIGTPDEQAGSQPIRPKQSKPQNRLRGTMHFVEVTSHSVLSHCN
jgi:hypothetical protein